ncbi:hypothetical protein HOY80DRAFT_185108 [Tuber brumale]|nr:hypothetical protein HOY80DRAFT_185108 [Tuber brumale]
MGCAFGSYSFTKLFSGFHYFCIFFSTMPFLYILYPTNCFPCAALAAGNILQFLLAFRLRPYPLVYRISICARRYDPNSPTAALELSTFIGSSLS